MKTKRVLSLVLAVLLCVGLLPLSVFATGKTYLALGDSISTGYGLDDADAEAFPNLVLAELGNGYTLVNKANNGETTTSLLANLQDTTYQQAIATADIITLTIGGNDLMGLLYGYLAGELNMSADEVRATLEDLQNNGETLALVAGIIQAENFESKFSLYVAQNLNSIVTNFGTIIKGIKKINSTATIIVTTQYNPYEKLAAEIQTLVAQYENFISADKIMLANAIVKLSNTVESFLTVQTEGTTPTYNINQLILGNATTLGYTAADVYSAFKADTANLCNPYINIVATSFPPNVEIGLDFHPNAAGHAKIAATIEPLLPVDEPVVPTTYTVTVAQAPTVPPLPPPLQQKQA